MSPENIKVVRSVLLRLAADSIEDILEGAPDIKGFKKLRPIEGYVDEHGDEKIHAAPEKGTWIIPYTGPDNIHLYVRVRESGGGEVNVWVYLKYQIEGKWETSQQNMGYSGKFDGIQKWVDKEMSYVKESIERQSLDGDDAIKEVRNLPGFTRKEGQGIAGDSSYEELYSRDKHGGKGSWVRFVSDDIVIVVNGGPISSVSSLKYSHGTSEGAYFSYYGHTLFKTPKGWRTYSRRGVDDSFYADEDDINKVLKEQVDRAKQGIEKSKSDLIVPVYRFILRPEEYEKHKKDLAAGKSIRLAPAGFGTGYTLSTRPSRWSKPASTEVAQFFGVPKLFAEAFDHD